MGFLAKSASAQIRCKYTKKTAQTTFFAHFFKLRFTYLLFFVSSPSAPPQNLPTNPQNSTSFYPNPTVFSSFSSIFSDFIAFFLSPQGEGKNFLARALCAHSDFSFFAFTPSPNPPKPLSHNTLSVKASPPKSFTRSLPQFHSRRRRIFGSEKRAHTPTIGRRKGEH